MESLIREQDTLIRVMNLLHENLSDNRTVTGPRRIWILEWTVAENPVVPPAVDVRGRPGSVREWDPWRKLTIQIEVAVEVLGKDKGAVQRTLQTELLGVTTDKPPHKKAPGKKSVVETFGLARDPQSPSRFDIAVKDFTDELKPSRPYPPGTTAAPPLTKGKYYLADVTLEIPIGKAPEAPAEPPKEK
jgi:hypothetical protein